MASPLPTVPPAAPVTARTWRGPVVLGVLLLVPTLAAMVYFASQAETAGGKIAVVVSLALGFAAFLATAVATMNRGPQAPAGEPGSDDEPRVP